MILSLTTVFRYIRVKNNTKLIIITETILLCICVYKSITFYKSYSNNIVTKLHGLR